MLLSSPFTSNTTPVSFVYPCLQAMMIATTFHSFPRLPSELRCEIYKLATPARVVHVRVRERAWELTRETDLYSHSKIPCLTTHLPRISSMSDEGWGYALAFRTQSSDPCTWFNFDRDVLCLIKSPRSHVEDNPLTLSGFKNCDAGQFDMADLQNVPELALDCPTSNVPVRLLRFPSTRTPAKRTH